MPVEAGPNPTKARQLYFQPFAIILALTAAFTVQPSPVHGQATEIAVLRAWDRDLPGAGDGFGTALAANGTALVVGAPNDSLGLPEHGAVYLFTRVGSAWRQSGKYSNGGPYDSFGHSLAVHEDWIVVGAPHYASGTLQPGWGNAFVDRRDDRGTANPDDDILTDSVRLSVTVTTGNDALGARTDIAERWIVVSHGGWNQRTGAVEVYRLDGNTIVYDGMLTRADGQHGDAFGSPLALSGDLLALGGVDEGRGVVFLYRNTEETWRAEACIPYRPGSLDIYGSDLLLGGDEPRIYQYNGATWVLTANLRDLLPSPPGAFGPNVHLADNLAFVGTPEYQSAAGGRLHGAVFVFERVDDVWTYREILLPSDTATSTLAGLSLATSGNHLLVGGYGAAWVFRVCTQCSALTDIQVFQTCFRAQVTSEDSCSEYDFTGDGFVGADDYRILNPAMTGP